MASLQIYLYNEAVYFTRRVDFKRDSVKDVQEHTSTHKCNNTEKDLSNIQSVESITKHVRKGRVTLLRLHGAFLIS